MNHLLIRFFSGKQVFIWKKLALVLIASTLLVNGQTPPIHATPEPVIVAQRQGDWDANLQTARLMDDRQQITALVMQLDLLNKPETTYANAVYQLFANVNGRWTEIYTNTGARLITNNQGRVTLAPEVVLLSDLQRRFERSTSLRGLNLENLELRSVVKLRYDLRNGQRDSQLEWQSTQTYSTIAQTRITQIVATGLTTEQSNGSQSNLNRRGDRNAHSGQFSLAIRQPQVTLSNVIARVSIQSRRREIYTQERFISDFRYRMNQRSQFIRGVNPGDRVVVRLFTPQNILIGYTTFELLADQSAVTLIIPSQSENFGTIRTVYGIDSNQDGAIDARTNVYDYFTQISNTRQLTQTRVTFLSVTQTINTQLFRIQGLPTPARTCVYRDSFQTGRFALVNRTIDAFGSRLASAIVSLPGAITQIVSLNSERIEVYQVRELIFSHQEVGISQGAITSIETNGNYGYDYTYNDDEDSHRDDEDSHHEDRDDDDNHSSGRRRCNQGIGNGAEGCDPGNSRPHGGSNDEGGRTPGRRGR
jgi:hypothetical protein